MDSNLNVLQSYTGECLSVSEGESVCENVEYVIFDKKVLLETLLPETALACKIVTYCSYIEL